MLSMCSITTFTILDIYSASVTIITTQMLDEICYNSIIYTNDPHIILYCLKSAKITVLIMYQINQNTEPLQAHYFISYPLFTANHVLDHTDRHLDPCLWTDKVIAGCRYLSVWLHYLIAMNYSLVLHNIHLNAITSVSVCPCYN